MTQVVNEELFTRAIRETKRHNKAMAKSLTFMIPDLLDVWQKLHPNVVATEAHHRDFKKFAKRSIKLLASDAHSEKAIIEFVKSIGSVRSYPAIRRVAVDIDNQRIIPV